MINKHRKSTDLSEIDCKQLLPSLLLVGIPLALASTSKTAYWGIDIHHQCTTQTQNHLASLPIVHKRMLLNLRVQAWLVHYVATLMSSSPLVHA